MCRISFSDGIRLKQQTLWAGAVALMLTFVLSEAEIITYSPSSQPTSDSCPEEGSSIRQVNGTTIECVTVNDLILSRELVSMAFMFVFITLSLGIAMLAWILRHKDDEIVKTSRNYVFLMIVGAMLSSLSLVAISFDTASGANPNLVSLGCQIAPFLYTIGWGLQLGSVAGLAYPVSRRAWSPHVYSYVEPRSPWPLYATFCFNTLTCTLWTLLSPMEFQRWTVSEEVDQNTGVITINTIGFCSAAGPISFWAFVGPILVIQASLLTRIVVLYATNRRKEEKFGQRQYCLFAALGSALLLVIFASLIVAVGENMTARYALLCWLVFGSDLVVVSLIFFPIRSRRKTCQEYNKSMQMSARQKKKQKLKKETETQKAAERERKMVAFHESNFHRGIDSLQLDDMKLEQEESNFPLGEEDEEEAGQRRGSQVIEQYDATS